MSFEPILAFFLVLHLYKTLKNFSPHPEWQKLLLRILYSIVIIAILQAVFPWSVFTWIWHLILLSIVIIPFRWVPFYPARTTIYAVIPLIVLSFLKDFLLVLPYSSFKNVSHYTDFIFPVAITWMFALLWLSKRQMKALKNERKKRLEEEEQNKKMEAQKMELEKLVAERTTEIIHQKEELEVAMEHLKETQALLIQKEKMASLGELTAGIAHEIKNPLNFINNFSDVNGELITEMYQELEKKNYEEVKKIAGYIENNSAKITHHGKLADAIVKSMLQHSRSSVGVKEPTDLNALADEYLRLCYHGVRAKDKSFKATLKTFYDDRIGKVEVVAQDIGRVLLNLYNNAFYSISEKRGKSINGEEMTVSVRTEKINGVVAIAVKDNGIGIGESIINKIYQPFFTTKPTGQGTGLGLSLSYDIIKAHGGEMKVESKEGEFAEFIVTLPA